MKIGIIAPLSSNQADTVRESMLCYPKYGNFEYHLVPLIQGELKFNLRNLDAILIHYSSIAYPLRHFLPMSAASALKIANFTGTKFCFVQDEQRPGLERLNFLNNLKIHHLFSVAPEPLLEVLYPRTLRNFTVSTVLTGYISERHLYYAKKIIPLNQRGIDVSYRGRRLPNWMGHTGTIKGSIPELIREQVNINEFWIDSSSEESDRFYEDEWFNFLLKSRISIGTPSGSDNLDIYGKYQEKWIPGNSVNHSALDPIAASYQVLSPRLFDYIAAGCLVALTPGSYSNVPVKNTYFELLPDLSNLSEVIEFSKSRSAQETVDRSRNTILNDVRYHFSHLVEEVENTYGKFQTSYIRNFFENKRFVTHTEIFYKKSFFEKVSPVTNTLRRVKSDKLISSLQRLKKTLLNMILSVNFENFKDIFQYQKILQINKFKYLVLLLRKDFRLELLTLETLSYTIDILKIRKYTEGQEFDKEIFFEISRDLRMPLDTFHKNDNLENTNCKTQWIVNYAGFGIPSYKKSLFWIPKYLQYDDNLFRNLLVQISKERNRGI